MSDSPLHFELNGQDGHARAGTISLRRGKIQTPIFMPVGTLGTVKSTSPQELRDLKVQILLGNTYHLYLRPGEEVLQAHGGLHDFMRWQGPILTDSGGFQFFSLNSLATHDDDGVTFKSHHDGSSHRFTPERVIDIQRTIGSDIMMVLDECPALPAPAEVLERAMRRSTSWALRSLEHRGDSQQALFAIVQGGTDLELRHKHLSELAPHGFDGLALGGLAVGETPSEMYSTLRAIVPSMPEERPRYLMGVGKPNDLLVGIESGIDMFDCVLPTRNARTGYAYTAWGRVNVRNARWKSHTGTLEDGCHCTACSGGFSIGYLHHLIRNQELLGLRLITLHNIAYYLRLTSAARAAIIDESFDDWAASKRAGWAEGISRGSGRA